MKTYFDKNRTLTMTRNVALATVAGSLLGFGSVANADLKIVEQITSPSRTGQTTQTVTAYFHGDKLRLENDKGAVTLIDTAAGKAYNLDVANKAYSERPLPPKPAAAPPDAPPSTLKLSATSATDTLAGKAATKYTLTGTTTMGPPPGRRPAGNAAGGPGGDQPGPPPAGGDAAPPDASATRPTETVAGEYWVTSALSKSLTSTATLPAYVDLVGGPIGRQGVDTLLAQFTSAGLFPLSSNVTATGPGRDGQTRTIKFSVTVQSVSTDTVDAALVTLPTDYTKSTERIPGVGGRPGGGPRPEGPPAPRQD